MHIFLWLILISLAIFLIFLGYSWLVKHRLLPQSRTPKIDSSSNVNTSDVSTKKSSTYSLPGKSISSRVEKVGQLSIAQSSKPPSDRSKYIPQTTSLPYLEKLVKDIIEIAWPSKEIQSQTQFLLNYEDFIKVQTSDQVIEVLLHHAKLITPKLEIPSVNQIALDSFINEVELLESFPDGGTPLSKLNLHEDKLAGQALITYAVSQTLWANSKFHTSDLQLKKSYINLFIFICGFGEIFLAGYKRVLANKRFERISHLYFLTDTEYKFVHQTLAQNRPTHINVSPISLEALEAQLLRLLHGDQSACHRLIAAERQRHPHASLDKHYRAVIYQLERDKER